jgi:transposase-like protein
MRYPAAEKARIMAAARRGGLTAQQVQEQFGVSPLTFYRWRGPVRGQGGPVSAGDSDLRAQVQARVRAILPGVIREEVNAYLASILGSHGPGRPRNGTEPPETAGTGRRRTRTGRTRRK